MTSSVTEKLSLWQNQAWKHVCGLSQSTTDQAAATWAGVVQEMI